MYGAQGRAEKDPVNQRSTKPQDNSQALDISRGLSGTVPLGSIAEAPDSRHFDPIEAASEDDARWFRENPRRNHRIRPPVPGELGFKEPYTAKPLTRWILVRQVKPGVRIRLSFAMCGAPAFTETAGKAICDRLLGIGGAGIFSRRPGNA